MFIFFDPTENVLTLTNYIYFYVFYVVKHCYLMYYMTSNSVEHDIYNKNYINLQNYDFITHFESK